MGMNLDNDQKSVISKSGREWIFAKSLRRDTSWQSAQLWKSLTPWISSP